MKNDEDKKLFDKDYNPADALYRALYEKETGGESAEGDEASDPDPDNVNDQESNPRDDWYSSEPVNKRASSFQEWLKGWRKNFGPSAAIFGLLTGGGTLMFSVFLLPASLTTALDRIMTNDASDSTRMNILMRRTFVSAVLGKADCSTKLKCRFSTMDKAQVDKWKAAGFTIEPDAPDSDGRYRIQRIGFPDNGPKFDNSRDFFAHVDGNLDARQHVDNVVNSRSGPYNAQFSKYRKVLGKYGLSKDRIFNISKDKDKATRTKTINEEIDKHTTAVTDTDSNEGGKKYAAKLEELKIFDSNISSRINKIIGGKTFDRLGKATDAVSSACMAYSFVNASTAGVKLLMYKELIEFAYPFFQTFAQAIDQGNIEPERIEYIGDRLTSYVTTEIRDLHQDLYGDYEDQELNKTAMDSRGIQAMISGNLQALKKFSEQYMGWKAATLVTGNAILGFIESATGGKENLKDICFGAKVVGYAMTAQCLASLPGAAVCATFFGLNAAFGDDIMKAAGAAIIAPALVFIANADLNSHLKGGRLGDALAAGISLMMADYARGGGLTAATSHAAIKKFVTETDDSYYKETEEIARRDAREQPFNTANQYSFINQLATSLNIGRSYSESQTFFSSLTNMFAVATSPILHLTSKADAALYQPTQLGIYAEERTAPDQCPDKVLQDLKILCDGVSGKTVGVAPDGVLEALNAQINGNRNIIAETLQYMLDNGFINKDSAEVTGDVNHDGPDGDNEGEGPEYEYIKWKNYCTEDRIDPVGMSTKSIDQTSSTEDMEWWIYARCIGKDHNGNDKNDPTLTKNLFYFSIWYNFCETQIPMASDVQACWDTLAAVTTNTGDWITPVAAQCTSPYGPRSGVGDADGFHNGVDIGGGMGQPILAPTSIRIVGAQTTAQNPSGGNTLIASATDGTGYGFIFMHMQNETPTSMIGREFPKGSEVGKVGNTGGVSPHLHMEVYPQGVDPNSFAGEVDPQQAFSQNGVDLGC